MLTKKRSYQKLVMLIIILTTCGGLLAGASLWFWYQYAQRPVNTLNKQTQVFEIETGEKLDLISKRLLEANLIRNPMVFKLVVAQLGISKRIQAGQFQLHQGMSIPTIAQTLTKGSAEQVKITLLEGWRREEMAQALQMAFSSAGGVFDTQIFLSLTQDKEGTLFPDTYFFNIKDSETTVVTKLVDNFTRKTQTLRENTNSRSFDQIVIMASLIEREARVDKAIVAGILWKRLDNNWPLQVDATLQYAKGYNSVTRDWWPEPLAQDKESASAYNTYKNLGLPPYPIANPSLDTIMATLNPSSSNYWYYLTDQSGTMRYAVDYREHLTNIDKYLR